MLITKRQLHKIFYDAIFENIVVQNIIVENKTNTEMTMKAPEDFYDKTTVTPLGDIKKIEKPSFDSASSAFSAVSPERKEYIRKNIDSIDPNVYTDDHGKIVHSELTDAERAFYVHHKAEIMQSSFAEKLRAKKEKEAIAAAERIKAMQQSPDQEATGVLQNYNPDMIYSDPNIGMIYSDPNIGMIYSDPGTTFNQDMLSIGDSDPGYKSK